MPTACVELMVVYSLFFRFNTPEANGGVFLGNAGYIFR